MDKIAMYRDEIMKVASQKKDDAKRDSDTETRMWRDRIKPEFKRAIKAVPRTVGGGLAGGVVGGLTGNQAIATGASTAGMLAGNYTKKRQLEKDELNRLSKKYTGKDATDEQHKTVRNKSLTSTVLSTIPGPIGIAGGMHTFNKTPESVIQRARREKEANK